MAGKRRFYFKVLKSGCRVEETTLWGLSDACCLVNGDVYLIVAWRALLVCRA